MDVDRNEAAERRGERRWKRSYVNFVRARTLPQLKLRHAQIMS